MCVDCNQVYLISPRGAALEGHPHPKKHKLSHQALKAEIKRYKKIKEQVRTRECEHVGLWTSYNKVLGGQHSPTK